MLEENGIAEAPGLYGTFSAEEKLVQKIWNNADFKTENILTTDGKNLKILDSGKWNLGDEGPDFKGCHNFDDGNELSGDVEIHFEEKDWKKHGHSDNSLPMQRLFCMLCSIRQKQERRGRFYQREQIAHFCFLPHLFKSLEEHAPRMMRWKNYPEYVIMKMLHPSIFQETGKMRENGQRKVDFKTAICQKKRIEAAGMGRCLPPMVS